MTTYQQLKSDGEKQLDEMCGLALKVYSASLSHNDGEQIPLQILTQRPTPKNVRLSFEALGNFLCETQLEDHKTEPAAWYLRRLWETNAEDWKAQRELVTRIVTLRDAQGNPCFRHEHISELAKLFRDSHASAEVLARTRGCSLEQASKALALEPWDDHAFTELQKELEPCEWPQDRERKRLAEQNRNVFNAMKERWQRHRPYSEVTGDDEASDMAKLFASA